MIDGGKMNGKKAAASAKNSSADQVQAGTVGAEEGARSAYEEEGTRSAYEKEHSGVVDPRCIPQTLESAPPIGDEIEYPGYSPQDHQTWRILVNRQMAMLPGHASQAFLRGVDMFGLQTDRIPALKNLDRVLRSATGWRVARIPGLLHERDFFTLLANRSFPSTDYIRRNDELDYTPAPDLFHDIFGHMPMLTQPEFADFYQMFGQASLKAMGSDRPRLERLHWFTVEFGLIRQENGIRIFGAGILSSRNEVKHALSDKVTRLPFAADTIVEQDYDVWHLQDVLFVLDSFDQLVDGFRKWAAIKELL